MIEILEAVVILLLLFLLVRNARIAIEYNRLIYLLHRGYRIFQVKPQILIMSRAQDPQVRVGKGKEPGYVAISIGEAYAIVRKQEGHHIEEGRRIQYKYKDQPTSDRLDWADEDLDKPPKYVAGGWK